MEKLAPRQRVPRAPIVDRENFILEYCRGRRVLHIGCANWPFTPDLMNRDLLLHKKLGDVCTELAGIDLSEEGIAFLKKSGLKNLFTGDATYPERLISALGWKPEVVLAGEVLEHMSAPGPLLTAYSQQLAEDCSLLVTVPNAFFLKGFLHALLGREKVHADHVAYYSYMTMSELLARSGFEVVDLRYYDTPGDNIPEKILDLFVRPLVLLRPHLSTGLIFCARPKRLEQLPS